MLPSGIQHDSIVCWTSARRLDAYLDCQEGLVNIVGIFLVEAGQQLQVAYREALAVELRYGRCEQRGTCTTQGKTSSQLFSIILTPGGRASTPLLIDSKACSSETGLSDILIDQRMVSDVRQRGTRRRRKNERHHHKSMLMRTVSIATMQSQTATTYCYFGYDDIGRRASESCSLHHGDSGCE